MILWTSCCCRLERGAHCTLGTTPRLKLDWLWHSQCHAQFPSPDAAVFTPFLSTWSKCQHFYDSTFSPLVVSCANTRGETLQLLLYTTAQTTYSLPHWHHSFLCCLSAVCFSAEWIRTEVLHLFMLTNHVWVIAHPQWSSKPSRRCQVCQTPFHPLLRKSSSGDVEYLESAKENFEYFLFFFFVFRGSSLLNKWKKENEASSCYYSSHTVEVYEMERLLWVSFPLLRKHCTFPLLPANYHIMLPITCSPGKVIAWVFFSPLNGQAPVNNA